MKIDNAVVVCRRWWLVAIALGGWWAVGNVARAADLYVSDPLGNVVRRYDSSGADLGVFASTGLNYPTGLAFDSGGNLYVGNGNSHEVRKFSSTGADLGVIATGTGGVALDASGNIYATSTFSIEKFSPAGVDLGPFATTGLAYVQALAFDSQGNLYASNGQSNEAVSGTVRKFSPVGDDLGAFVSGGVQYPQGLAFDALGNLFVADIDGPYQVRKYDPTGTDLGAFATSGFVSPMGLAFDESGILYVGSFYPFAAIQRFDATGADLGTFGSAGAGYQAGFLAFAPVPEPSGLLLAGSAGALLLACRPTYQAKYQAWLALGSRTRSWPRRRFFWVSTA